MRLNVVHTKNKVSWHTHTHRWLCSSPQTCLDMSLRFRLMSVRFGDKRNYLWISCGQVAETECLHGSLSTEGPPGAALLLLLLLPLYIHPHLLLSEWTVERRVRMRMCWVTDERRETLEHPLSADVFPMPNGSRATKRQKVGRRSPKDQPNRPKDYTLWRLSA